MKGEYVEEKDHSNSMFAKLHHHHQTQPHHQQPPSYHPAAAAHQHHQHFQFSRECQTSEEADSRSPSHVTTPTTSNKEPPTTANDGASIEVVRRPRGRPPGSKNKPKPPVIITRDTEPAMRPYKRNTGLCVLTGSGTVANVTLLQPSTTPGATVTFHGRFDILSISATILSGVATSMTTPFANGFTISLAGPQGQIVGGTVVGPLMAAGTVYVIAASFNNPSYHRLPCEDEARNTGSGGGGGNDGQSRSPAASGGGDSGHPPGQAAESCGMSIYGCHLPSDFLYFLVDFQIFRAKNLSYFSVTKLNTQPLTWYQFIDEAVYFVPTNDAAFLDPSSP
ncbi:hypothetical protein RJ639_036540 [Escallonia herrerae]|uniref:PPC domain-containing protein n=1 Tax=Escallonia herrerae TaxID=1293975 RepID=A0AA89BG06_9ASTE|nr:hypothetical protein RJ639_036540 [Escallonia herrerae]